MIKSYNWIQTLSKDGIQPTKVYISTSGCIEGQLSSKVLERYLEKNNYTITHMVSEADYIVFYACGLTEYSEKKSLQALEKLRMMMTKKAKLIIWGCLTKQNPDVLNNIQLGETSNHMNLSLRQTLENSDISLNGIPIAASMEELTQMREASPEVISEQLDSLTRGLLIAKQGEKKLKDILSRRKSIYYIRVATGCNGNCTYCSEKPVFGTIKSRPLEDILIDFKNGLSLGYNRFSLLATDLGAYGLDMGWNLGRLLDQIIEIKTEINYKLILNQIEPHNLKTIYPFFEKAFASEKVEELMSPVQSGSNRILKLMGRKYTIEEWKGIMLKINTAYPHIRLNTHFLVGFPTESEDDFNETMKILDPPPFIDVITVFKYSSRPVVPSRLMKGEICEDIKEDRRKKLIRKYARQRPRIAWK
jgi:MiaB/RimO family radical SAM methylthiotransferase